VPDNPLEETPEREARIRDRAYRLWEADGRPHGREKEFWERAEELIGMEDNPTAGQVPVTSGNVEEAEIQENYGEVPGRLTDQGDRAQTPVPRARSRRNNKRTAS
jgi:hypothetical protein